MSSPGSNSVVITQLVVDASGANVGVAEFEAQMDRARDSAVQTGETIQSFDSVLKRWTQSLASTDPVLRAQVAQQQALNRQLLLNKEAVALGIATQDAANAQLDRVREKYEGYIRAAKGAEQGQSALNRVMEIAAGTAAGYLSVLTPERIIEFGKQLFESAAALKAQAEQAGVSIEGLQAYRAALESNGIAADQTDQILTKLTHGIGDAQRQAGPARDAFNQLGIGIDTLKGGAEETLPALAQALLRIQDPSRRAALEVDLLGRSGQRLESALRVLADPLSTIIEKEKALGQVMGDEVAVKADEVSNRLTEAWHRIKNEVTPLVVDLTEKLLDYSDAAAKAVGNSERTASGLPSAIEEAFPGYAADVQRRAAAARGVANAKAIADANGSSAFGFPITGAVLTGGVHAGQTIDQATKDQLSFNSTELDQYIAKQRLSASIAGQGPIVQAETNALIEAANTKLQAGAGLSAEQLKHFQDAGGEQRKFVTSADEAVYVLGQATAHEVKGLAATIARGAQWNKVRETFDGYLASVKEEARIAGESAAQRQTELAIIKGAQVAQAAAGVEAKDRVQTYDAALGKLSATQVSEIRIAEAAKQSAGFHKDITDQLTLANVAAANGIDDRELALAIAQKQLDLGRQLTDQEKQQLELIQQKTDTARLRDYTQQLQDEASLAGLSADERERGAAILEAMRITHGRLTDQQKSEIDGIIATRQETERWRQVVDGIGGDFQNFFEDLATKGKASFGDLARAIQGEFAHLLAWMASQALIQPIIVPMVGEMAGAFGLQLPGGIGGSGPLSGPTGNGGLNLLSSGASLASSAGLLGGVGGAINGLGASLGFDFALGGGAGSAVSLGSIAGAGGAVNLGSISSALPSATGAGSIFGTSLGGFLGGAGLGALASNLVFGNKNDAGLGGLGGAAAGAAIIPGVGTIIGGLIGGLAGGGLGSLTGSSNQGAIANFTNGGASSYLFKAGGGNNGQLSTQAANTVSQAITTLQQAGVDVSLGNITGLSIGSDKSYVYDSAGGKQKLSGGDPAAVVSAILDRILPSASGSTPEAQAILSRYASQGGINASNLSQLESDLGAAKNFADALSNLKESGQVLSQVGQQMKNLSDQYDSLIAQAKQYGLDTSQIDQAYQAQLQAIAGAFNDNVGDAIAKITDPVGQAFDQLIASQKQRLADAQAVAGDIDQVNRLSNLELTQFFQGLSSDQLGLLGSERGLYGNAGFSDALTAANDLQALNGSIADLSTSAQDAASAASKAASSWGSAHDALLKASTMLLISDQSLSPTDQYRNSAAQFGKLRDAAQGGDVNAANDLASFASDFLQTSYSYNGSTAAYTQDLSYVQNTLNTLATFSEGQKSLAQRQADSAAQAVTVLQTINQTLNSQKAETVQQLQALAAQVADLAAQIQAGNRQARFAS